MKMFLDDTFYFPLPFRPRTEPRTMHPISWPRCDQIPDGSNKADEVKVSRATVQVCAILFKRALFSSVLSWLPGGFQAMPSSLRQPGPRANLRHMSPSGTQGPRGAVHIISSSTLHFIA